MSKALPRVRITAEEISGRFKYYTPGAMYGVKLIEALPDEALRDCILPIETSVFRTVSDAIGKNTNAYWITTQAAEVLYTRGLLSAEDLNRIYRD
jgi:hypothetical protein